MLSLQAQKKIANVQLEKFLLIVLISKIFLLTRFDTPEHIFVAPWGSSLENNLAQVFILVVAEISDVALRPGLKGL